MCDFCGVEPAVIMTSNLADGQTVATCGQCLPAFLGMIAQQFGLLPAEDTAPEAAQDTPETTPDAPHGGDDAPSGDDASTPPARRPRKRSGSAGSP